MTQAHGGTKARKHKIVSRKAWLEARKELLAKEKVFTRQRDKLATLRRELPWEKVDKSYVFEGLHGGKTLAELFDDKSQLVVYHFMFAPSRNEGCPHCSFWADSFDGIVVHLKHRDVAFVAISRAPAIRATRAASTCSIRPTITSISFPRAATRTRSNSSSPGSASTTGTRSKRKLAGDRATGHRRRYFPAAR